MRMPLWFWIIGVVLIIVSTIITIAIANSDMPLIWKWILLKN